MIKKWKFEHLLCAFLGIACLAALNTIANQIGEIEGYKLAIADYKLKLATEEHCSKFIKEWDKRSKEQHD